jgi:hypothetical protein
MKKNTRPTINLYCTDTYISLKERKAQILKCTHKLYFVLSKKAI